MGENQEPRTQNQRVMGENQEPRTQNQPYSYRNLVLWQKAQELTLEVIRLVAALPRDRAANIIANQIIRSSSSMGGNISEGHGRYSLPAHRNHLSIAKGSACETDNWLDLLKRAGFLSPEAEARLHSACEELIRMLTKKILDFERMESKSRRPGIAEEQALYTTGEVADDQVPGSGF